jgi:serine/threonine protein kinase
MAPEGLCPACLAKVALDTEPAESSSPPPHGPSPLASVRYFGDYELLEEIARGGMGVVYKARQASLNRIVAVKMILAGQLAGEMEVRRFRSEAEAAAQLQHPNIVAIHEVGEHQGQQYFSMDFVAGKSLAARLGNEPLPIGEAVRWMKTIAEAVHFAHQRGIVHRDLKPANVLLDEFDQPRITDFGLAKRLERVEQLTASGAILGTPDYMSPEQAAGRQDIVGPAGDVFSLGAMLYVMLTGRVPFRGTNLAETLSHILQSEPVPPSRLNPRVPPELETICLKCLEKRPDRRYTTAAALAKDLGCFLNREAISAKPVGATRLVSRWLMGHPQTLAGLASGILLALVWLGYGLWTENRILTWEKDSGTELTSTRGLWKSERSTVLSFYLALLTLGVMVGLRDLLAKRTRARVMTGRFVSPRILEAFGLAGLAGIALGVYFGSAGIESCLWAKHLLPRARSELAAQLAAESKEKELMDLSQKQVLHLYNETQKFSKKVLQHSLKEGEVKLENDLIDELTNKVSQLQIQEQQAALKSQALGPSVTTIIEIEKLQSEAVGGRLEVLVATVAVWFAAALTLKAFREQRFTFFHSAEEEQTALSQALLEQQVAAEKERQRRRSLHFTVILISVLPLSFPYLYWQDGEEASLKVIFLLAEVSAFTLALIASLQSWRRLSPWRAMSRVLLVLSILIAAVALLHGPASLVERGIGFGAATGIALGLFMRWGGRKKVL